MQKEDREGFFAEPVPIEYAIAMQYHTVVDQPMDFKTMKAKIVNNGARRAPPRAALLRVPRRAPIAATPRPPSPDRKLWWRVVH